MKVRDSGMPDRGSWETFFDPFEVFENLGLGDPQGTIVDFGSGYGTFTLPAAKHFPKSQIVGLDIEAEMTEEVAAKALTEGFSNVSTTTRDFVAEGTGIASDSIDIVFLFNILHAEHPVALLEEAVRILKPGSIAAIIHWNHDPKTPRGPKMEFRPSPDQMLAWTALAGLITPDSVKPVAAYHYGFLATKPGVQP